MSATLLRIQYRLKYYKRRLWLFLGKCPRCGCPVNYTTKGRPICPNC